MPESNQTEKATPQRRKKAREQGQVARSRELGGVMALLCTAVMLSSMHVDMAAHWRSFYSGLLELSTQDDFTPCGPLLFWTSLEILRWTAPILLMTLCVSTGITLTQGGLVFAPAALAPKAERLSPSNKLKQILSLTSAVNLLKSTIPFMAIAFFSVAVIRSYWSELIRASGADFRSVALLVGEIVHAVGWRASLVLLAWAAFDYLMVWQRNESQLRMSHDEIRREHKETDGNPFTKGQIRKRQRAMRNRKPLEAAATATMVVTNPTHFAVALKYEPTMIAPEVVAKGQDLLAQKIKAIALENDVPTIESKSLARALYRSVEVGHAIPPELYQAVAEILVVVFRAQTEARERERRSRLNTNNEVQP